MKNQNVLMKLFNNKKYIKTWKLKSLIRTKTTAAAGPTKE